MEDETRPGEPMKLIKIYTAILLSAFLVIGGGACAKKEAPKTAPEPAKEESAAKEEKPGDSVQQKVLSFNLEGFTNKGTKSWEVKGDTAQAISENEVGLDNIVAKAYGEQAEATITADTGVYDRVKNNVHLEKNVHATIDNAEEVSANFLDMSAQAKDPAQPKAEKKNTRTIITCDGEVEFNYQANQAYFNKNVKVVSDDGNNIIADKITVFFDPQTKKVKNILAEGHVRISRGENVTFSDKATYQDTDKKVVLSGSPRLEIYQDSELGKNLSGK